MSRNKDNETGLSGDMVSSFGEPVSNNASTEPRDFFLTEAGLLGTGGLGLDGEDLLLSRDASLPSDVRLSEPDRRKVKSGSWLFIVPEGVNTSLEASLAAVRSTCLRSTSGSFDC